MTATAASRAWVTSRGGAVVIEQIDTKDQAKDQRLIHCRQIDKVIENPILSRAAPKCGYGLD